MLFVVATYGLGCAPDQIFFLFFCFVFLFFFLVFLLFVSYNFRTSPALTDNRLQCRRCRLRRSYCDGYARRPCAAARGQRAVCADPARGSARRRHGHAKVRHGPRLLPRRIDARRGHRQRRGQARRYDPRGCAGERRGSVVRGPGVVCW
jgi:hypothetical protein